MTLFEPILTLADLGPKWLPPILLSLFIFVSVLMVLVVLIQKPQGGGLSGAFGGSSAGSGQTAFGTKTGDALTLFTVGVFVVFVILAILLNLALKPVKTTAGTAVQPTGNTTPADTTPAENKPAESPAAPVDNTLGGALPTELPTAPVSPGAELPSPVTTPATPATTPATEPTTPPAPKPDGGM